MTCSLLSPRIHSGVTFLSQRLHRTFKHFFCNPDLP